MRLHTLRVDLAEKAILNRAYGINAEAPEQFAKALAIIWRQIYYISVPIFVFDGRKK